jgi:hypothetical protein
MDTAPDDKVAVMSMRAAAHQFGYLVGAAGGLAVGLAGFQGPASPREPCPLSPRSIVLDHD